MVRPIQPYAGPPPMPDVKSIQVPLADASAALDRARRAWSKTQVLKALRDVKEYIASAEQHLTKGDGNEQANNSSD